MSSLETVDLEGVFPQKYSRRAHSSCLQYKPISGRNGDHKWLRITTAFILCDIFWKVQKSHAANREGSLNSHVI